MAFGDGVRGERGVERRQIDDAPRPANLRTSPRPLPIEQTHAIESVRLTDENVLREQIGMRKSGGMHSRDFTANHFRHASGLFGVLPQETIERLQIAFFLQENERLAVLFAEPKLNHRRLAFAAA